MSGCQRYDILEKRWDGSYRKAGTVAQAAPRLWIWQAVQDLTGRSRTGRAPTQKRAEALLIQADRAGHRRRR